MSETPNHYIILLQIFHTWKIENTKSNDGFRAHKNKTKKINQNKDSSKYVNQENYNLGLHMNEQTRKSRTKLNHTIHQTDRDCSSHSQYNKHFTGIDEHWENFKFLIM